MVLVLQQRCKTELSKAITWRCRSPGRVIVSVRVADIPFILSAIACAYQRHTTDVLAGKALKAPAQAGG